MRAFRSWTDRRVPAPPAQDFYAQLCEWPEESCRFGAGQGREWAALSNMQHQSLTVAAVVAASCETLYQAAKFPAYPALQLQILQAGSREAKAEAQRQAQFVVQDWQKRRRRAMLVALILKLDQHPAVASCLRSTRSHLIVEVSGTDAFWGSIPMEGGYRGTNMLGRLWMFLRLRSPDELARLTEWATREIPSSWPGAVASFAE